MTAKTAFNDGDQNVHYPRVILICPTYRMEKDGAYENDEAYRARFEGIRDLYNQFLAQDYPTDKIELRYIDSSEKPHPFFEELEDPRVTYIHVPDRTQGTKDALAKTHPEAAEFLLTDEELSTPEFRATVEALHTYCSKRLDPQSARMIPSIADPRDSARPTIGMMRNMLCAMPFTADGSNGDADIIIAADDDDWRSSAYTKLMVQALENSDWTKLVNYHLAIYRSDRDKFEWGKKEFQLVDSANTTTGDPHSLPTVSFSDKALIYKKESGYNKVSPDDAFNSPRWHPLSTDGAVHALRHDAWRRTVDLFGGYLPVSYNEDTLMFESLRMLGHLDQLEETERSPYITRALTGGRKLTADVIAADKKRGPATFNPQDADNFDFLRMCCANVSPVALSSLVDKDEVPYEIQGAFELVKSSPKARPAQHQLDQRKPNNP